MKITSVILYNLIIFLFLGNEVISEDLQYENPVKFHGQLSVDGRDLVNKNGKPVQLRGISSFWLNWKGEFSNYSSLETLKKDWGITVFRAAMAVEEVDGYIENPQGMVSKVDDLIKACIDLDLYIIVDYHSHKATDNLEDAKKFFKWVSWKYGDYPNIIYELWNEPLKVSWNEEIRPYMIEVTKIIREHDHDNIILAGTPYWCQRTEEAFNNPLDDKNTMYTLHFYSGSAGEKRINEADQMWLKGCPIFVSEFGVSIYDGGTLDRNVYLETADKWIDWMNKRKISWVAWSLCDKDESSALLIPGASKLGEWNSNELSKAGIYIKEKITD